MQQIILLLFETNKESIMCNAIRNVKCYIGGVNLDSSQDKKRSSARSLFCLSDYLSVCLSACMCLYVCLSVGGWVGGHGDGGGTRRSYRVSSLLPETPIGRPSSPPLDGDESIPNMPFGFCKFMINTETGRGASIFYRLFGKPNSERWIAWVPKSNAM